MPSPPIIKYGDDLNTKKVQPGWTIESDGFGLLQSSVTFKLKRGDSHLGNFSNEFARGDAHPDPAYSAYLKLFRASLVCDKTDVLTIRADYCGIDPGRSEIGYTNPQVMMTSAAASESIQSHPNFIRINCTSIVGSLPSQKPLAGYPPPNGGYVDDSVNNPFRAAWTPKVAGTGLINNCQFIAFLPNQKAEDTTPNIKAGIKSYYKPQNTLRVLTYYTSETTALGLSSYVGWVTTGTTYALPENYKKLGKPQEDGGFPGGMNYVPEWKNRVKPNFLVTNCSVELYGTIYKVTTDLTLSGLGGWDPDVYPVIPGGG
jgi:hypothetical protein